MAATQYIGARYVPLFYTNPDDGSNNWKSGVVYDPLTIVSDINQSYTSKIPVPASVGRPSENPTYWILTGNYNAQVSELSTQVSELSNDLTGLSANVTQLAENVEDIEDSMIKAERRIIVIMDSYGTYNGGGTQLSANVYDRLVSYLGWDSSSIDYHAQNGAGFVNGLFQTLIEAADTTNANEVADVYVIGGWNDELNRTADHTAAGIRSAAATFLTYVQNTFPNASVHVMFDAWGYRSANNMQNVMGARDAYMSLREHGWAYHERMEYVMHNSSLFLTGEVHPNQAGVNAIAAALASEICGQPAHVEYRITQSWADEYGTPVASHPSTSNLRVQSVMVNGAVNMDFYIARGLMTYTETTNWECTGAASYEILRLNGDWIARGYLNNIAANVTMLAYDEAGNEYVVPGLITWDSGIFYFLPSMKLRADGGAHTIAVKKFMLPMAHFAFTISHYMY